MTKKAYSASPPKKTIALKQIGRPQTLIIVKDRKEQENANQ